MSELPLPRELNRRIWRAVTEFGLIDPGDRILVGFSGGKDSALLLYALRSLQLHNRLIPFSLAAVTLDPGFSPGFPPRGMAEFARGLEVDWHVLRTRIADTPGVKKDFCAACSYFRRGAINRFARENGFNRIALAHHHDDAVTTFLMSILYAGKLQTLPPRADLRGGLRVIRPLIYVREAQIRRNIGLTGFTPVDPGCPYAVDTKRAAVSALIKRLSRDNRFIYTNIAAAMREGPHVDLWPPLPDRDEMRRIHRRFFNRKQVDATSEPD